MVHLAVFTWIDWGVLLGYMALVMAIGTLAARRKTDAEGYFLAGRSMPSWAVALSIIATTLSIATFTGVPQIGFTGDLTYLSLNIGGFAAVVIVALFFVPRLYRANTVTIYGFIEQRFGPEAKVAMSCTFLFGRLLASGARLFMAAIPVCLLLWGDGANGARISTTHLIWAIILIGSIGTAYTISGGIRAVIWTDTLQITIVFGAALVSLILLLRQIPLDLSQIIAVLKTAGPDQTSKLRLVDTTLDATSDFTIWTALIGNLILTVAVYGTDHDMAQRMLTAKSPMRGAVSLIAAQALGLVVVSVFIALGLLLHIFYARPDLMGAAAPADALQSSMQVYPQFLLNHLPVGLAGLAMAGMFAAAQGSLDSAINAMASSAAADLYWPMRTRRGGPVHASDASPRLLVMIVGVVLILFAIAAALIYDPKKDSLIKFALGIMCYAYSGMLAVFITALFTRRGNTWSVIAALITGVAVTVLLQPKVLGWWRAGLIEYVGPNAAYIPPELGTFWWMPLATLLSLFVCLIGRAPSARENPVAHAKPLSVSAGIG